jgi:hypothetical protein
MFYRVYCGDYIMKRVLSLLPYALIALAVVIVVIYLNNEAAQMTAGTYYDR